MRFQGFTIPSGVSVPTADPRADPEDVRGLQVLDFPETNRGSDRQPSRILLTAEGTAAATIDVELFAQAEDANKFENQGDSIKDGQAARRFYQINTVALQLTVGELSEITANVPPGGKIYVRVTARSAGVDYEVLVRCVD